ncbi:MAG TPA: WecB/TagA/CpsF family glycosyltransferase [Rhizomicrobium sp.]
MRTALPLPFSVPAHPAPPANDAYGEVMVGGLKIARLSRDQLAAQMLHDCLAARETGAPPRLVFAANGHSVALTGSDPHFAALFDEADLVHADGQAIVFASKFTAAPIPERSATTDFIHDAAKMAAGQGLRFFLLGATEEANKAAAEKLVGLYPGLQIVGRRHGYFSIDEEEEICDEINLCTPDVIWVGMGVPREYDFAVRNRPFLTAGWLVTCGGGFNFVTGAYRRAPDWMQKSGLEWAFRLWREPKRLFWRYLTTNPLAIFLLLTRTNSRIAGQAAPPAPQRQEQVRLAS